jgi:2,3-bisphosphoglycerate-independent phosphoglycerate mutase
MIQQKNLNPTMLIILDGFGYRKETEGNAIKLAKMKYWEQWSKIYPSVLLNASGNAVGLPSGFIGNSEVGHVCIGSGRIVKTILARFSKEIENKTFFKNKLLISNFEKLKKENKTLHLMGLLSDGGVHSHELHLFALIELAKKVGLNNVLIHPFLDGRDVSPKSAATYLANLENVCKKFNLGQIATIHGRFFAMDRDNNWDRTQISYNTLCIPQENLSPTTWQQALEDSYKKNIFDEFFVPTQIIKNATIQQDDGIVFFNFRPDRARQLTQTFIDPKFDHFVTKDLNSTKKTLSFFISTTRYKKDFEQFNNQILFEKEKIEHTFLDEISAQTNKKVFIIAETEKYAHVTYFFRGETEKKLPNEEYTLIPSIKAKDYVHHPEMSAPKITQAILESLQKNLAYFYLVNFANPDMVGHSGNLEATIKACKCIDEQLEKIYIEVVEKQNGTIFITGDHGNAEEMIDSSGNPKTSHTTNPVVFMAINKKFELKNIQEECTPQFGISNIAPTILQFLGLKIPKEMNKPLNNFI